MTQTKQYERDKIVLSDLYLMYPYKTRDINSKTVPFPYFPKDEITNSKYSLTFKEWKKGVQVYLKNVEEYLYNGGKFKVPSRMGVMQIRKAKYAGISYQHYNKTGEFKKMNNEYLKDNAPLFKWDVNKIDDCPLKFKRIWGCLFTKSAWKRLMKRLNSNFSMINNFIND